MDTTLRSVIRYVPETGQFFWLAPAQGRRVTRVAGGLTADGYVSIYVNGRRYLAHRLAFLLMTGLLPSGGVDHIDGNPLNNRWSNLRSATSHQNNCNRPLGATNRSGFKGVHWDKSKKRWRAACKVHGRRHHLGWFSEPEAAYAAYCEAAPRLHGEFHHPG
jgi:hypothetical protein